MIRAAFFDIDGTLVSFRTHRVPASAHEALRDVPLDARDVKTIVEKADAGLFEIQVMQLGRDFVNRRSERVRRCEEEVGTRALELSLEHAWDEPVYQLCAFVDPGDEGVFADECVSVAYTRWCDAFCDVIPAG